MFMEHILGWEILPLNLMRKMPFELILENFNHQDRIQHTPHIFEPQGGKFCVLKPFLDQHYFILIDKRSRKIVSRKGTWKSYDETSLEDLYLSNYEYWWFDSATNSLVMRQNNNSDLMVYAGLFSSWPTISPDALR